MATTKPETAAAREKRSLKSLGVGLRKKSFENYVRGKKGMKMSHAAGSNAKRTAA